MEITLRRSLRYLSSQSQFKSQTGVKFHAMAMFQCFEFPSIYFCDHELLFKTLQYCYILLAADRSNDCISSNDPSCITRCLRRDNMQGQCVCPPGMALHDDNETCIGNSSF
jgi:hypothetical protein